jgi:sigma-B regulation protein RsbU (phosphoserine phosphatase)
MACRSLPRVTRTLVSLLCVAALLVFVSRSAAAQAFDATNLRTPSQLGTVGVVQVGDNPAYSQADFDDSHWLPVDAKTLLSGYFPHQQSPVIWRRLHVKVSPQQTDLALQAYFISRAFEVYVNGQKLIESGGVDPYVAYTRNARLIVHVPVADLHTGSLVIAIRARAPRTWWSSPTAGFSGHMLTLGDESTLRERNLLSMIGENAISVLENILALGVGLVALALFLSQRERAEYFWIFCLGLLSGLTLPFLVVSLIRNIPVSWWALNEVFQFGIYLALLLTVQAFLRKPLGRFLWLCSIVSFFIAVACDEVFLYGLVPSSWDAFFVIPIGIIFSGVVPILLFRQLRRGDREAGILLIPMLLSSVWVYAYIVLGLVLLIPPMAASAYHIWQTINAFPVGIVNVGLADLGSLSFNFSLAIIMVLRSTRMSRQQAVLENEMAAAREVQQVILPDAVETVPGFTIESVYQPAQQVGGDFFQILPDSRGGLLIVVGDVAGKGLPAAMLVSVLVGAIRTAASYSQSPSEVLCQLNERLVGRTHGGFSTALAAHITADGWVTIANAGHLSPYLDGKEVGLPGALPLGIVGNAVYETTQFHLPHGSRLTFYSDGVVEAQNQKGELFGFDRAKHLSTQTAASIVQTAVQFGQSDDITVVAIRRASVIATAA